MTLRIRTFIFFGALAIFFLWAYLIANAQQPTPSPPQPDPVTSSIAQQIGQLTIANAQCSATTIALQGQLAQVTKERDELRATTITPSPTIPKGK